MDYAIIKLGNKQHRVKHGETLVVDRLPTEEGQTFEPVVLLGDTSVTATVLAHGRGPKLVIGKYRKRTGYKRHNGFRAAVSRVEISLGSGAAKPAAAKAGAAPKAARPKAEAVPAVEPVSPVEPEPAVEAVAADEAASTTEAGPTGLPAGYEGFTVAQVAAGVKGWSHEQIEAALAYEQAHADRKGARAALESALAKGDH